MFAKWPQWLKWISVSAWAMAAPCLLAQRQELGLTLGGIVPVERQTRAGVTFTLGSDLALQADYGFRVWDGGRVAVLLGGHFLATPNRVVTGLGPPAQFLTRDVATIYATPAMTVKFLPRGRFIPWATAGGGVAVYEQSNFLLNGRPNPVARDVTHGAFVYGGGLDVPVWRWVALRGEARDFYTSNPAYNDLLVHSKQHNVVFGGGIVLRFGKR